MDGKVIIFVGAVAAINHSQSSPMDFIYFQQW